MKLQSSPVEKQIEKRGVTHSEMETILARNGMRDVPVLLDSELGKLLKLPQNRKLQLCVINAGGHYVGCAINRGDSDASLELFDSLGKNEGLERVFDFFEKHNDHFFPRVYAKVKTNSIPFQKSESPLCAYHVARFLVKRRQRGSNFKAASGFVDQDAEFQKKLRQENRFDILV